MFAASANSGMVPLVNLNRLVLIASAVVLFSVATEVRAQLSDPFTLIPDSPLIVAIDPF